MTLEEAENHRRRLASDVKRLRVAAMSDPQRADELADALVEQTGAALGAWDDADAAATAPEAAVLAARALAARGATGPYASLADAVRFFTATTQLAAVQAGAGHTDAAGRTLDGLDAWRPQVSRLPLADNLPDAVALWLLVARARVALATDVALANALADAAELRLHAGSAPAYVALAVHLVTADARWAGGRPESALTHHRLALDTHRAATDDPAAARRPAVAKVSLAPVPAVYETYADRLAATGDLTGAIALRRAELAVLGTFGGADAFARTELARTLATTGRHDEAAAISPDVPGPRTLPTPGERVDWEPAPPATSLASADADTGDAAARWRWAEQAAGFAAMASRAEAERDEATLRASAEDAARQRAAAQAEAEWAQAEAARASEVAREERERREAEQAAVRADQEQEALRAAAEERRLALAREHQPTVDPDAARAAAAELELARDAVRHAQGDAAVAAAQDRLAEVLRPLAAVDPAYRPELVATLEALVGLLWRLGDADGSRAAAREARTLA
ncbi:MAG: hypothetical protein LCH96_12615 [Actinobacteria bacterium]|nr:hypothetical protein [Actinomycetota bacterium]